MAKNSSLNIGNKQANPRPNSLEIAMMAEKLCGDAKLGYCGKCVDFKEPCEMFKTPPCGHSICNHCMHEHVASNLRENSLHVPCPFKDCHVMFKPRCFRFILPQEVLRRWESALFEHKMILDHVQESKKRGRDVE